MCPVNNRTSKIFSFQLNAEHNATENLNENDIALENNETALSLKADEGKCTVEILRYCIWRKNMIKCIMQYFKIEV